MISVVILGINKYPGHDHVDSTSEHLMERLRNAGFRTTGSRRVVLEMIARHKRPFSGAEILAEIQASTRPVGRATVFRTLDVLQELGMLDRVEQQDGNWRYVVCPSGHHHHAVCSSCGIVVDLKGCDLGQQAEREALQSGFAIQGHRLEYFGLCGACQVDRGTAGVAAGSASGAGGVS